jgi:hypothetical protein
MEDEQSLEMWKLIFTAARQSSLKWRSLESSQLLDFFKKTDDSQPSVCALKFLQ